jgi:ring-1,2-phenylacetyl-CoA epoxidase subunit PaaE
MAPHGSFTWDFAASAANHYVGFAGGSGITPVMSLLKTALLTEPAAASPCSTAIATASR